MQQSSSLSTKSYNNNNLLDQDRKNTSPVNWISVINFLQNQYTNASIRQKQWYLQKKLLNQEILKLKNQLNSVERLNSNLNNRIKLLQNALKKQKLLKNPNTKPQQQQKLQHKRTIQQIQKYFEKNGWNLKQKPVNLQQNPHKQFLSKVLDQAGLNFTKIDQKYRKMSMASLDNQKLQRANTIERANTSQKFQNLINQLNKVKVNTKIKINAHLDSIRGLFATKNLATQNLVISVSEDCLVKVWNIDDKNQKSESIEHISCLREHTGQLFTIDGGNSNYGNNDLIAFTAGTQEYVKVWYTPSQEKPQSFKCIGWFSNEKQQNLDQSQQLSNEIIWHMKYKDNKLLTSASDGTVRLFNTQVYEQDNKFISNVKLLNQYNQKGYIQTAVQWVGDRAFITGCTNSPKIHLWDLQKKKIVQRYLYEIDKQKDDKNNIKKQSNYSSLFQINSLKYVDDFKLIYTGCQDKSIRIFSYDENKMIKKLDNGINDSINCIDMYKNNLIVAGCQNGTLKIWDRRTYKLLIDQKGHKNKYDQGILCVKALADGIFTGGADGVINYYAI